MYINEKEKKYFQSNLPTKYFVLLEVFSSKYTRNSALVVNVFSLLDINIRYCVSNETQSEYKKYSNTLVLKHVLVSTASFYSTKSCVKFLKDLADWKADKRHMMEISYP